MSHEIDGGNFLCWRGGNGIAIHQCPNHYKNYEKVWSQQDYSAGIIERLRQKAGSNNGTLSLGSSCGTAQVIVNPQYFIKEYEDVRDEAECGGTRNEKTIIFMVWSGTYRLFKYYETISSSRYYFYPFTIYYFLKQKE